MINSKKINKNGKKRRILVAPLDWGYGHATRCIPLINQILLSGAEVLIAAEGVTALLLKKEFPGLIFLELSGYRVKYTRKKKFLAFKVLLQLPKIILSIYKEHQWLKKIITTHKITAVISDNRPGLFSRKIPCIYITHQLLIKTGNGLIEKLVQRIHYWFIKKYDECWVPDFVDISLAGELSNPAVLADNVKYIGALSRLEKIKDVAKEYDLLILISGPEPQRTILEKFLLHEIKNFNGSFLFIRGLADNEVPSPSEHQAGKIINYLAGKELSEAIQKAKIIISRSGYTTIMDLVKLQQKAILIPTPGQTEQEYLAKYLMDQKMFYTVEQNDFNLNKALKEASAFNIPLYNMDEYKITLRNFISSL